MKKHKIILDCDPGHDDAVAILMAARHPAIDLLAITIVAGNQTLEKTLVNGLNVCQHLGIDTPVYSGMPLPMVREQVVAASIHGETGLDGPVFGPLHKKPEEKHAVNAIIDLLMESDGDITLVPVGPLSNIGMAMRMEPRIIPKIKEIVLMGGAYGVGNITPAAEFNFFVDPEAAHVVFTSGVPIVMMGLDLTNQTVCTMNIIERMEAVGNIAGKMFGDIMRFTYRTQNEVYGLDGGPVHDATCIGYLIDPTIFEVKDMYTEIDITGGPSYGRSVCDVFGNSHKSPNCKVGITLDNKRFWDLVEDCIQMYH
jgi:ribosylpyrimidine nucleosidase